MKKLMILATIALTLMFSGCTQETQNKIGRSIQNWTGTNGVLDVYMGDKLVKRFIKIDKLSTAESTQGSNPRTYRYGYGVLTFFMTIQVLSNL
jgi:protein involved in sex pheromone biosynthesis